MKLRIDHRKAYFEQCAQMARETWFNHHRATVLEYATTTEHKLVGFEPAAITHLRWEEPGTSNYLVLYFLHRTTLFVSGDLGSAVYRWGGSEMDFSWIAKCDYGYFAEKFEGLQRGGGPVIWDADVCVGRTGQYLKENQRVARSLRGWKDTAAASRDEWRQFLWDHAASIGFEAAGDLSEFGDVPDNRSIGHWIGLQMAVAQLQRPSAQPDTVGAGMCVHLVDRSKCASCASA